MIYWPDLPESAPLPVGITAIRAAAERNDCTPEGVTGPLHHPNLVAARREVTRELRGRKWSLPRIGRLLGGRHHTTILHYLQTSKAAS